MIGSLGGALLPALCPCLDRGCVQIMMTSMNAMVTLIAIRQLVVIQGANPGLAASHVPDGARWAAAVGAVVAALPPTGSAGPVAAASEAAALPATGTSASAGRADVAFYWAALYWAAGSGIQFLRVRRAWSSTPLVLSLNLAMCWLT